VRPLSHAAAILPPVPPVSAAIPVIQTTVKAGVPTNIEVLIDGKIVGAVLTVTTPTGAGSTGNSVAEIAGPDWSVTIRSTSPSTDTGGNSGQTITFERGVGATIAGSGFAPFILVIVYMFSDPIAIGQVMTDSKGSFNGTFTIPDGLTVGDHTLQLSGQAPNGQVRTASVAVAVMKKLPVKSSATPKPAKNNGASAKPILPNPNISVTPAAEENVSAPGKAIAIALLVFGVSLFIFLVWRRRKVQTAPLGGSSPSISVDAVSRNSDTGDVNLTQEQKMIQSLYAEIDSKTSPVKKAAPKKKAAVKKAAPKKPGR
jgi:hypothetical protein